MGVLDYLRLGSAGIWTHKKHTLTIVMIVGLLFSIITAGAFVLQGLQSIALGEMLAPTNSRVLVMSSIDTRVCDEDCDMLSEVAAIKTNIEKYGGRVIPTTYNQTSDGIFYQLSKDIFNNYQSVNTGEDVSEVLITLHTLNQLAGKEINEHDSSSELTVEDINKLRAENLHKIITTKSGKKYYIAGILPGGASSSSLSLAYVGQDSNPLNLLLEQVSLGGSASFIIKPSNDNITGELPDSKRPSGIIEQYDIDVETTGLVFADFPNLETAYNYYRDEANYCSEFNRFSGNCGRNYKYHTIAAVSDPLGTYRNLQEIWKVFKIVATVLCVIALIIATTTYTRLIEKDKKIISLYHSMGATNCQIRLLYTIHFLTLSLMAVAFAIFIGITLAIALSLINQSALTQVFILGFGMPSGQIWLVGWNSMIYYILDTVISAAVLAVLFNGKQFSSKKLTRNML